MSDDKRVSKTTLVKTRSMGKLGCAILLKHEQLMLTKSLPLLGRKLKIKDHEIYFEMTYTFEYTMKSFYY